jgi:hypothetical protein
MNSIHGEETHRQPRTEEKCMMHKVATYKWVLMYQYVWPKSEKKYMIHKEAT